MGDVTGRSDKSYPSPQRKSSHNQPRIVKPGSIQQANCPASHHHSQSRSMMNDRRMRGTSQANCSEPCRHSPTIPQAGIQPRAAKVNSPLANTRCTRILSTCVTISFRCQSPSDALPNFHPPPPDRLRSLQPLLPASPYSFCVPEILTASPSFSLYPM